MRHHIYENFIIKSFNDQNVLISGYASVYNVADLHNDIILPGAFATTNHENIKFLWQHDQLKPIGVINNLFEDEYGLKIEAIINNKIAVGHEAISLIKQGAINSLSIGFNIISSTYNSQDQRLITKAELIEISIVTFPANNYTKISSIGNNKIKNYLNNIKGEQMENEVITKKINDLEEKVENLQSWMGRPEVGIFQDLEYKTAFNNYVRKGEETEFVKKSLSSGNEEGGALIIPTLYNKIISEITALSPMRQLASIETISSNALDIVIEDGKFARGWIGETVEREETDTPKLLQKRIFVHELYAQPKATQRLIDDSAIQIESWLIERLRDHFVKVENTAFINGDGDKKPKGILGVDHKIKVIEAGAKVTVDKLIELINSLEEEYLTNAAFLMNRTTFSEIQKLKDEAGRLIWQASLTDPMKQTIFGIPIICCGEMPSIANEACAIAFGDFKAAYKIVDRSGINIMRDPYTNKPFVKFYAVKRVGGDIINPNALRLLKFNE